MCDRSQPFGLLVPQLAMQCESVFDALMLLSSVSFGDLSPAAFGIGPSERIAFYSNAAAHPNGLGRMATLVLFKAQRFVRDIPRSWEPVFAEMDNDGPQSLLPVQVQDTKQRRLWLAMLVTIAKLGKLVQSRYSTITDCKAQRSQTHS